MAVPKPNYRSMYFIGMLFLFQLQSGFAQQIQPKKNHSVNPNPAGSPVPATGILNVLAIMVEFEPDSNRLTSGTGIFGPGGLPYLENAPEMSIDPLPHDKKYFEAHLEFAKNYYEKASNGKLTINYRVLPAVYRLDKKMEEYSPTGEAFTYEKIATLIQDSWNKVEEAGGFDDTGLNSDETAFVIFHAGVGRDIELTGTTLDITPLDIPSVYLGKQRLGELLNAPNFTGIPVNGGSFRITNSMIIPRTESRRGLDIQQNEFVFPLSINGLLCASIGSHLGLPDLFNTQTGESGIGRFGLMDGAGFFSYNGLFPPLPSAWERIFLGWETPFTVTKHTPDSVALPAVALGQANSIARYNLSSTEYFLIENRHRDLTGNGVTLTIRKADGTLVHQNFDNKNNQFVFQEEGFEQLLEKGVLVNVDNFDWSLPGGYDIGTDNRENTADDRFLNGGILIWHVDEAVIEQHLAENAVNNHPGRRGLVLMEADGAQDIGNPVSGISDNSMAYGTPFDFWWKNNDYRVITENTTISLYKNEFSPASTPGNNSNSGAVSDFRFYDFSDNLPIAYFKIAPFNAENTPTLVNSHRINSNLLYTPATLGGTAYPLSLTYSNSGGAETFIVPAEDGAYFYYPDADSYTVAAAGQMQQPLAGNSIFLAENDESQHQLRIIPFKLESGSWAKKNEIITAPDAGLLSSVNADSVAIDGSRAGISKNDLMLNPNHRAEAVQESEKIGGVLAQNFGGRISFKTGGTPVPDFSKTSSTTRSYVGLVELENNGYGFFILEDEGLIFVNPENSNPFVNLHSGGPIDWPAIADFDRDGELDFIFVDYAHNQIKAVNQNGGLLAGFPFGISAGEKMTGTPLIADLDGDNEPEIVITTQSDYDINLRILKSDGTEAGYSPLYVGGVSNKTAQAVNPILAGNKVVAVAHTGELKSWQFDALDKTHWSYKYGRPETNKVSGKLQNIIPKPLTFRILNDAETYNWPNPAGDFTNLRFQLIRPGGSVEVTVISLSGAIIYKQTFQSAGGAPEEVELDTSGWNSGGYYAMVKATVNGKSESKLVKIAVTH